MFHEEHSSGRRDSSTLKFRQKDSISSPESIAREVVEMLNSGGGEVWIGIKEQDGSGIRGTKAGPLQAWRAIARQQPVFPSGGVFRYGEILQPR